MATESVAMRLEVAHSRIREAIAIQELIGRTNNDNVEDFEMVRQACWVTFRLLEEASSGIEAASTNGGQ